VYCMLLSARCLVVKLCELPMHMLLDALESHNNPPTCLPQVLAMALESRAGVLLLSDETLLCKAFQVGAAA
jgi:hypothetical protein